MTNLPYIASPGNIQRALDGIIQAPVPDRVSQDFVKSILKITGSSGDQVTSFLKKIGFADPSGSATDIYRKFRNSASRGTAAAQALKHGYAELYKHSEYVHTMDDNEIEGLIVQVTGSAANARNVKLTLNCFKNLRVYADFNSGEAKLPDFQDKKENTDRQEPISSKRIHREAQGSFGLNLGYTININLPTTTDQEVFNAIFKSIKQNLLTDDDA
ncbi:DUF5343 domain-containing protein [Roseovarius sp. MS2]|uniref:DUF5343 domain-containing protein n=1 Tax=Roseovarius sp. MS2 TaxID=3390728 RepID=UPI003EDB9A72